MVRRWPPGRAEEADREATLERYRLALALVPDEDVAGDLFMRARSEAELRAMAQRWHRAQGLAFAPRPLPELDEFQQAHGMHLYLRGRSRRRSVRVLGAALLLSALVALTWGGTRLSRESALPAALRQAPVRVVLLNDGRRLLVYEARVTPGEVTLLWELTGPGAQRAHKAPLLELPDLEEGVAAHATEWLRVEGNRVAARSTYKLYVTTAQTVRLRYGAGSPTEWVVECPLEGVQAGSESEVLVQRKTGTDPYAVEIEAVLLSQHQTRVRYRAPVPPGGRAAAPVELQANNRRLKPRAMSSPGSGSDLMEAVFGEIPHGVTRLTILFDPAREMVGPVVYRMPAPTVLSNVSRLGDRAHVLYRPGRSLVPRIAPGSMPYFTDQQGRRFEIIEIPPQGWDGIVQYSLVVLDPPVDAEFVTLTIPTAQRLYLVEPVRLDLTRP